jgi:hypothetical protein
MHRRILLGLAGACALSAQKTTATSYSNVMPVRQADGSYKLAATPKTCNVYRNGLRMAPGVDYTLGGMLIVPSYTWDAADTVLVDYTCLT